MAYQGQTLTFTIPSSGSYNGGPQSARFAGNSISNNQAWVSIQSINVSYNDDKDDHYRGISQFIPRISSVNGTEVTVDLQFLYANKDQNDIMSGTVEVLVTADVI